MYISFHLHLTFGFFIHQDVHHCSPPSPKTHSTTLLLPTSLWPTSWCLSCIHAIRSFLSARMSSSLLEACRLRTWCSSTCRQKNFTRSSLCQHVRKKVRHSYMCTILWYNYDAVSYLPVEVLSKVSGTNFPSIRGAFQLLKILQSLWITPHKRCKLAQFYVC